MLRHRLVNLDRSRLVAVVAAIGGKFIPAARSKRFPTGVLGIIAIQGASTSNRFTVRGNRAATLLTMGTRREYALLRVVPRFHITVVVHALTLA